MKEFRYKFMVTIEKDTDYFNIVMRDKKGEKQEIECGNLNRIPFKYFNQNSAVLGIINCLLNKFSQNNFNNKLDDFIIDECKKCDEGGK